MLNGKNFPDENCNALAFTIFQEDGIVAIHALLGQFIILGFIKHSPKWKWKGTEINPISGQIGVQQTIPQVYATWLAKMFAEIERVSVNDWKRRNNVRTEQVIRPERE